jgi:predicted ATPase
VSVSPNPTTEDEIATVISNNRYLETKISHYLEKIADRDLRVHSKPGTAIFSLTSYDRKSGTATDLVNEGFGLNQAVQLLAKCLDESSETVCIEEPEIHLHPTAVRKLAHCFVEMTKEESKRFLLTTHSETLVLALAAMVSRGELAPEDLAFYFVHKDKKATSATRETVNEQGQISEGLSTFMQAEVEDLRTLLSE